MEFLLSLCTIERILNYNQTRTRLSSNEKKLDKVNEFLIGFMHSINWTRQIFIAFNVSSFFSISIIRYKRIPTDYLMNGYGWMNQFIEMCSINFSLIYFIASKTINIRSEFYQNVDNLKKKIYFIFYIFSHNTIF